MPSQVLFESRDHKNVLMKDLTMGQMVQANQHVIIHKGKAVLLDPGGHKVYSNLLSELSTVVQFGNLKYIFFSHQDPDIIAAANGWLILTEAQALLSKLWTRFILHFGVEDRVVNRILPIPDEGMTIDLEGCKLLIIPAHFMHSPGNFQIYDPESKILYTGDLGASLGQNYTVVEDFESHIQYMEGFHKRYIASGKTLKLWARMVSALDIEIIAPQHGAMITGTENVTRFINWLSNLPCGVDIMDDVYKLPR